MLRIFPVITGVVFCSTLLLLPDIVSPTISIAQPQAQLEQLEQDAEAAYETGNFAEAEEIWRRVLRLTSDNANAHLRLGEVLDRQGRVEAEHYFRQSVRLSPDNAYAHYRFASFLSWYGRYQEAEPLYLRAIQLNPSDFRPYSELGQRLQFDNRYEDAETLYRQAIEVNPQNIEAYDSLALVLQNQGRQDEAEAIYRQAIEAYPTIESYQRLGLLLESHGRYGEAEEVYHQLVDYFVQNYEHSVDTEGVGQTRVLVHHSYYILGRFFERYECYDEAEETYRELITYDPDNAGAYLLLGDVLGLQGRDGEAQSAYRQAAEIDPSLR